MYFDSWSLKYIENIVEKRLEQFLLFYTIFCYLLLNSHLKQGPDFHFETSVYSR